MTCHIRIVIAEAPFEPEAELKKLRARLDDSGGLVSFVGRVRGTAGAAPVQALRIEHYPAMTEPALHAEAQQAAQLWPLEAVLVVHRVGVLAPGEPIVLAAAASRHRRAAFEAVDCLMDYLKCRAVFWKQEITPDGASWIEPRAEDHRDAARWVREPV